LFTHKNSVTGITPPLSLQDTEKLGKV